jgi:hypothetical protein
MTKEEKGKNRGKKKRLHSCCWRFATHSSIQEFQPSTVMLQSLRRLGHFVLISKLLLSKSVIIFYGKLTLAVESELLKAGPPTSGHDCHQLCQFRFRISHIRSLSSARYPMNLPSKILHVFLLIFAPVQAP